MLSRFQKNDVYFFKKNVDKLWIFKKSYFQYDTYWKIKKCIRKKTLRYTF